MFAEGEEKKNLDKFALGNESATDLRSAQIENKDNPFMGYLNFLSPSLNVFRIQIRHLAISAQVDIETSQVEQPYSPTSLPYRTDVTLM
ncbi:Hypothetical predicted protein [Octopus vulgaris]|uniref:Uncharacterized protein n=1 Tax=Octopus vulgaris TaxID=6645 RepID=A0AA36AUD5_OCTVU|nr:Hypothetical predicted protein [Octopus vulgaris]